MKKFLFLIIIGIPFLLFLSGCSKNNSNDEEPAQVVKEYFRAWDNADYEKMYGLISDGFKDIEPTAISLDNFKNYAESQRITSVEITDITLDSNTGNTATVDYDVTFLVNKKEVPFQGIFTLKYKPNDARPGWKLIHPYGENIDTT